jgi:NACHT domain
LKAESLLLHKLPHAKDGSFVSGNSEPCLSGTRTAELQHIEHWEVDPTRRPICWLSGIVGSGKTTIARTFAERSNQNGRLGASFFCSHTSAGRRNIKLIFPTLAFQLAVRYPEYRSALIPILRSNPDAGHQSLDDQFEYLLVQPLKSTKLSITIVIDALDECEDNQPTSSILSLLARRLGEISSVKFFITGRPEPSIRSAFRLQSLQPHTEVFILHEVDQASVDHDIGLYFKTCLSRIAVQRSDVDLTTQWPTDQDTIAAVKMCSGLFIVASLIVKSVADSLEDPREQLESIIAGLDNAVFKGESGFDRIYYQVFLKYRETGNVEYFAQLKLVIGSIVLAFIPLSRSSLTGILGMPSVKVLMVLRFLHSVFIVPDSASDPVRICHKSLMQYLTDST